MALIVMPSLLSKRPWARIRARCEASFFIVLSKSARCCSVRGHTYLTLIHLGSGFTYRIVLKLSRGILYQKTFGRALITATVTDTVVMQLQDLVQAGFPGENAKISHMFRMPLSKSTSWLLSK